MGLVAENPKTGHHKPESHQRDARANPSEKCSLFRAIVPQVSHSLYLGWGYPFRLRTIGRYEDRLPLGGASLSARGIGEDGQYAGSKRSAQKSAAREGLAHDIALS